MITIKDRRVTCDNIKEIIEECKSSINVDGITIGIIEDCQFVNCYFANNFICSNMIFRNVFFDRCTFVETIRFDNCALQVEFYACRIDCLCISHNNDFYYGNNQRVEFNKTAVDSCYINVDYLTAIHLCRSVVDIVDIAMNYELLEIFKSSFSVPCLDTFDGINQDSLNRYFPSLCPEDGFVGWKKVKLQSFEPKFNLDEPFVYIGEDQYCIVKLWIPADAKRSSGTGRKCRAEKVWVLEFQNFKGEKLPNDTVGVSKHDGKTLYKYRHCVKADSFNEDRWMSCTNGIHFFITREEAINYDFS